MKKEYKMKYELWVYLEKNDFWFKALTTSNQQVLEIKKQRLNNQGHKVKESINYIGVVNV
jgi:transcriptional regulator CtsR